MIGPQVRIGRDCSIGPNATVLNALLGNRVILHPGVRVGQDGFGFAMGPRGHMKVPQIGRVIIQDDVEIGANTTIDRGASRDTVIGEGTKIDNLVQIGHNVVIGRHCVIVAQVGISGSTTLEDFVVLGGQVGVVGHVRIGTGAQIAGSSNVNSDVPPGARWGGTPAKPIRDWFREMTTLKNACIATRSRQRRRSARRAESSLRGRLQGPVSPDDRDAEPRSESRRHPATSWRLLPHRYPFLLVDRIIEIDGDNSCIGIKNVTMNEPQFTGHFPARPLFPGVLHRSRAWRRRPARFASSDEARPASGGRRRCSS